jgi:hypothetical protein
MGWLSSLLPSQKAYKIEQLKPTFSRDGVKRIRVSWGPYKLKGANVRSKFDVEGAFANEDLILRARRDMEMAFPWIQVAQAGCTQLQVCTARDMNALHDSGLTKSHLSDDFPRDVTILRTSTYLTFEDGQVADMKNGIYEHHVAYPDISKSTPTAISCKNGWGSFRNPASIFMGGSVDGGSNLLTSPDGQFNSGFYIDKNDVMMQTGDVVNYNNETRTIFSVAEVEYLDGKPPGLMEASVQMFAIGQCDSFLPGLVLNAPAGQKKFTVKGTEMVVNFDGYFLQNSKRNIEAP